MGLYAEFDVGELGLVSTMDMLVEDMIPVFVNMDWAPACEAFVETFLREAEALVPVRTGYLRSTIDASTDGYHCYAEATAEYAEYVEYGTSYMDAQPYFEPALEKAMIEFWEVVEDIKDEAKSEAIQQATAGLDGMSVSPLDIVLMMLIAMLLMFIEVIIDEMFEEFFGTHIPGDLQVPEVIIT